ncbi:MAG: Crp/Fnr family transcriptional regulator [Burkholderiales bacterium]
MRATTIDTLAVLRQTHCFRGIEPELLDHLADEARLVNYVNGEVVTHLGQHFHHLAVIVDGQIELSVTNRAGKRHVLNVLRAGQLYGLIPMLDGEPLYYGATAITPCTMITLSRETMVDAMHRSSALMMGVFGVMCKRSRDTFSAMADQHLLSPTARLARHLITLASTYGPPGKPQQGIFEVDFSQSDLAEMLGISRQSLNLSMKQLEKSGLIEQKYSKVSIKSIAQLEQLVKDEL